METTDQIDIPEDFQTIQVLPSGTSLMVHIRPSMDISEDRAKFLIHGLKTEKYEEKCFIEITLSEDLMMNLHGVTQGKFQDCKCFIPALSTEVKSVNNAFTAISREYEKWRTGHGGSVFIKVYFKDKDDLWRPLGKLREHLDKTYDSEIKKSFRAAFLKLSRVDKVDVLSNLLTWLVQKDGSEQVLNTLKRLDVDSLQKINALLGVSNLKKVLDIWESNRTNASEGFWQKFLTDHSFVLSQVFSSPVILFREKAYVGGKGLSNTGGKFIDYLFTNKLTKNAALIEIKTPMTKLIGGMYRDAVFSPSPEISGAVLQLTDYRNVLVRKFDSLHDEGNKIEVFSPICLLIAGTLERELSDRMRRNSFEMYRTNLRDVQLITFDELFSKIGILVNLLEGSEHQPTLNFETKGNHH